MYTRSSVILFLHYIFSITSSQPLIDARCDKGCQILYNQDLDCVSHQALIPSRYINNIPQLLTDRNYICYHPYNYISNEALTNPNAQTSSTIFNLQSYALIWHVIIIATVVPLLAFMLFKALLLLLNKILDVLHCNCKQNKRCKCCLYCCSAEYRQQQRNGRFDHDIYNNNNGNQNEKSWKWIFGRKNNEENVANDNDAPQINGELDVNAVEHQYQHIPFNDEKEGPSHNIIEEVSVEHNDNIENYLQAPGGASQDIELSFSSQGLRQISYRDVV